VCVCVWAVVQRTCTHDIHASRCLGHTGTCMCVRACARVCMCLCMQNVCVYVCVCASVRVCEFSFARPVHAPTPCITQTHVMGTHTTHNTHSTHNTLITHAHTYAHTHKYSPILKNTHTHVYTRSCPSDAEENAALFNMSCAYVQLGQSSSALTCLEAVLDNGTCLEAVLDEVTCCEAVLE
jgi:hypothetical protein